MHCRFTLNQNVAALRLLGLFERQLDGLQGAQPVDDDDTLCPICKAPLPDDEDECPTCVRELHTPPSTWTLLPALAVCATPNGRCWRASC